MLQTNLRAYHANNNYDYLGLNDKNEHCFLHAYHNGRVVGKKPILFVGNTIFSEYLDILISKKKCYQTKPSAISHWKGERMAHVVMI